VFLSFARRLRRRKFFSLAAAPNYTSPEGVTATSNDPTAVCAKSAPLRNNGALIARRHSESRIINGWLILTAIVGACIVLADGLTRAPNPGLELAPPQPLEYEACRATFLFAGVTLPLLFAYAKKARLSLAETLFVWFVFCTTAYLKDFSYLRWPGVPLFVTDVVLVVLLLLVFVTRPRRTPSRPLILNLSLTFFVAAGMLAATRGFVAHRESMLVLRDSALVAYSFFLLVGYHILHNSLSIKRAAVWFVLGTALSVLNGLGWLIVAPEQRRFVAPGIYVMISLVGVLVMMANRLILPRLGWFLVALLSLGLLLANTRTLFVSAGVLSLVALVIPGLLHPQIRSGGLATALAGAASLVCLLGLFYFYSQAGRGLTTRVAEELDRGILHSSEDPNWQFRLTAWKEAWRRFEQYPPAGEGFGNLFNFEIWDNDPRPHNTFLTVLYKMGLIGFLPFFFILASFFWLALRAVRRNSAKHGIHFLQIMILAQVSFCIWGEANFVLESPFLASLFWIGMGAGFRLIQKFNYEESLPSLASVLRSNGKILQSFRGAAL
jgi:O-antigen ligase